MTGWLTFASFANAFWERPFASRNSLILVPTLIFPFYKPAYFASIKVYLLTAVIGTPITSLCLMLGQQLNGLFPILVRNLRSLVQRVSRSR